MPKICSWARRRRFPRSSFASCTFSCATRSAGSGSIAGSAKPLCRQPLLILDCEGDILETLARITLPEQGIETLFGSYDENLKTIESQFGVRVRTQGHDVIVDGPPADVSKAERLFTQLGTLFQEGYRVSNGDVKTAAQLVAADPNIDLREYFLKTTQTQSGKRRIAPKSINQRRYL